MIIVEKTELINKLKEIINTFDLTHIKCMCISGSYSLDFIKECSDVDIHCFIDKDYLDETRLEIINPLREKCKEEIGDFISIVVHPDDDYIGTKTVRLFKDFTDRKTQRISLRTYAYEFNSHFYINLYGDAENYLGRFDILGKDKEDYLANLKYDTTSESFLHQVERFGRTKRLYHILCGIYMIENNSYELTEEQIKNVNIAHDKTDGWEELYEWAKNELEKLTNEKN